MAVLGRQVFVATLFLIIFTLDYGTCLHCYSCSSGPDELCDDKFSFEAHRVVQVMSCEYSPLLSKPGAGPNTHCGKSKRFDKKPSVDNKDYVFRGCVPENYCRLVKNEVSDCEICETERCNSSPTILPSFMFLIISLLLLKCKF
ncbi:hypothetical protein ILUMI_16628 [Ignelater luminosus]|uniref:Protein sleepless n=1 Tax=Ignelater luminosus TaxID=2038154 RepID=A0A8K0G2P4_IGNLU|nr:hypothetical protein ILUMI_16628 [Ignelater luminosus]